MESTILSVLHVLTYLNSIKCWEGGIIIIPILWMWELRLNKDDSSLDLVLTQRKKEQEWQDREPQGSLNRAVGPLCWQLTASWPLSLGFAISMTQCPHLWDFCACSCPSNASWFLPVQNLFMVTATLDSSSSSRPLCLAFLRHPSSSVLPHLPDSVSVTHPGPQDDQVVPVNLCHLYLCGTFTPDRRLASGHL